MSCTNSSRNKALLATAAVGAGALLAGAGLLLYSHFEEKKKLQRLQGQLARNSEYSSSSTRNRSCSTSSSEVFFSARNSDEEEEEEEFEECASDVERLESEEGKMFEEVDALMKGDDGDRLKAYSTLVNHKEKLEENVEFLWRFAKANQMQATACEAEEDLEGKKTHVLEGLKYASKALSLSDKNADVHKWFAILTGMQADFVPIKEKIENGFLFQKHLLIALKMKPKDYSLHHLLGRFKFEIASTSWLEKKIAASLFSELPQATYKDAIEDLLNAEKLNSTPWKENRLLLARCYIGNGEYSAGAKWLDSAKKITPKTKEDKASDLQINLLLRKYKNYLN